MPREYARVKLSIWADDDYRSLSREAQHLYFVLLTSPKLDYCGVTDWRAGRIAALSGNLTADQVEHAAAELAERLYIVIDTETEEVLIRSFIRNDGLMDQPNVAVSMMNAHAAIASTGLRRIVVHELRRLHASNPNLKGWTRVSQLLDGASLDPKDHPSFTPSVRGSVTPSGSPSVTANPNPSVNPSPTTAPTPAPTPAPPSGAAQQRGTRLPENWKPTPDDVAWQRDKGISDLLARRALEQFGLYWTAKAGRDAIKLDWSKTWRRWLITEQERAPTSLAANGTQPIDPATGRPRARTDF